MINVRDAVATNDYLVAIRDESGACSLVDLSSYMHGNLAPCADPDVFRTLRAALGTIVWPGGFDIAPENVFVSRIPGTEDVARASLERVTYEVPERTMMLHPLEHHMPIVSVFYGLIIMMFYDEHRHNIPHIHVRYAEHNVSIEINTCDVIVGLLPQTKLRLVEAWIEIHRDELLANWELMKAGEKPERVRPLE